MKTIKFDLKKKKKKKEHDVNVESKKDKGFDNPAFIVGGMSLGVAASDDNT